MSLIRMTPAKLAANRANAKLSTGPKTSEGKARSAQNATTWGFTAARKGMPADWHEAALRKGEEISSEFSDPTERALIAHHVYLLIWRRYIAHLEAHALNQFPDWLAIIREPGLFRSINRACARVDHLARGGHASASTNPYLSDSRTPLVAWARAGSAPALRIYLPAPGTCDLVSTNPYLSDSTTPPEWLDTS